MRVLHCCLAAFYIDDFGYQENILPKIHKMQGHEVKIIASTETYGKNRVLKYVEPKSYLTKEGIPITRLPYVNIINFSLSRKLRKYSGLYKELLTFQPDIIFLHDVQFMSVDEIIKYKIKYPSTKIVADSHTDLFNSGRSWLSLNILHKVIYKLFAKKIEPYVEWFYGTLPIRNQFLQEVYGIAKNKIKLLPFGTDDTMYSVKNRNEIRNEVRLELGLSETDFVLITGGKIDKRKNIHNLLKAFEKVKSSNKFQNLKLILFGSPTPDMLETINGLLNQIKDIIYLEWLKPVDFHKYFFASDLAFYPGTHSVLWEESVGLGIPCVFRKWDGITHLNVGNNCSFINDGEDVEEIKDSILELLNNPTKYLELKNNAQKLGPENFSYSLIANKSITI